MMEASLSLIILLTGLLVHTQATPTTTSTTTSDFTTPTTTIPTTTAQVRIATTQSTTPEFTTPTKVTTPTTTRFTTPRFTTPTTTPPAPKTCKCQKIHVTGPEKYQASSLGFYTLQKCQYNDRAVYKHDDRDLYMYFSNSSNWAVSLGLDQGDMLLRVGDNAVSPVNVSLDWTVMDGLATDTYKMEPKVKVSCACNGISCPRLSMRSSSERAALGGEFVSTGELLNGRPIYVNENEGLHLYLKKSDTCVYWAVGPTPGGDSAIMVANDAALTPEDISAKWNVHLKSASKQEWTRDYDITLSCLT